MALTAEVGQEGSKTIRSESHLVHPLGGVGVAELALLEDEPVELVVHAVVAFLEDRH